MADVREIMKIKSKESTFYLEVRSKSKNAVLCMELFDMQDLFERAISDIENDLGMNIGNPAYSEKVVISLEAMIKRYRNLLEVVKRKGTSKIIT